MLLFSDFFRSNSFIFEPKVENTYMDLLIYLVNKQAGWHFFPTLLVYFGLLIYWALQSTDLEAASLETMPKFPHPPTSWPRFAYSQMWYGELGMFVQLY